MTGGCELGSRPQRKKRKMYKAVVHLLSQHLRPNWQQCGEDVVVGGIKDRRVGLNKEVIPGATLLEKNQSFNLVCLFIVR